MYFYFSSSSEQSSSVQSSSVPPSQESLSLQCRVGESNEQLAQRFYSHDQQVSSSHFCKRTYTCELYTNTHCNTTHIAITMLPCTLCNSSKVETTSLREVGVTVEGNSPIIFKCNFHVLSNLLLIYIWKLHWNLNTMFVCQVNYFWFTYVIPMS